MKLYFKVTTDYAANAIRELLDPEHNTMPHMTLGIVYSVEKGEPETWSWPDSEIDESYIMTIETADDVERFEKIFNGEVLARFNDGKIKYSFIDFSMFIDAFDAMPNTFNKIDKYEGRVEMLYEKILAQLSKLCMRTIGYRTLVYRLQRILILSYKASLIVHGLESDTAQFNMEAFDDMARVLEFGAKKYERNNWMKKPLDKCDAVDSLDRHIKSLKKGEEIDPDSGIHHIGHIMCNAMFIHHHFLEHFAHEYSYDAPEPPEKLPSN